MPFSFDSEYKFPTTIEEIDEMTGKEFEEFLFHFFKLENYKTTITDDTGDRGIDIIITTENNTRIGIQAKRWKNNIGTTEIAKIINGKVYYGLDKLWIITTSYLTQQAQNTALNQDIRIIPRNEILDILDSIKSNPKAKFRNNTKKIEQKPYYYEVKEFTTETLYNSLKDLRLELSKKFKQYPTYVVYSNDTIKDLCSQHPLSKEELHNIKGLGEKRIEQYGETIISSIYKFYGIDDKEKIEKLLNIRQRIIEYNNLDGIENAFNNETLLLLIKNKPTSLEELKQINSFPKQNIDIFGEYLLKQLKKI